MLHNLSHPPLVHYGNARAWPRARSTVTPSRDLNGLAPKYGNAGITWVHFFRNYDPNEY
jgi:hypothetical protein